jgi:hypothetical protein
MKDIEKITVDCVAGEFSRQTVGLEVGDVRDLIFTAIRSVLDGLY